jgi:dihydroorotase
MKIKLKNALVFQPPKEHLERVDITVENGYIAKLGPTPDNTVDRTIDLSGKIIAPPLIDIHTHVYHLATSLGVKPNPVSRTTGVDILVDAGSAGAGNFKGFREYIIKKSECMVLAFLNISFGGIPFFGIKNGAIQVGEIPKMSAADVEECVHCGRINRKYIVGIKVRVSLNANGELGVEPVIAAKRCSKKLGVPLMVHFGANPPLLKDILPHLEKGDILTHAFRPEPNSILQDSETLKAVMHARDKGVILDVGHGSGSFSFSTAINAFELGLYPDIISTDLHAYNINGPVFDLPTTMTKLLSLGMTLEQVLAAVTTKPSAALNLRQLSSIEEGKPVRLVILELKRGRFVLKDSMGITRVTKWFIAPFATFKNGELKLLNYNIPV